LAPLTSIVEKKNTMEVDGAKVPIVLKNIFLSAGSGFGISTSNLDHNLVRHMPLIF